MDGEYNFLADALSKFHTAPVIVQVLLILAIVAIILGIGWCLTVSLRLWLTLRSKPALEPKGRLLHGVVCAPDGRWLVYVDGKASELDTAAVEEIEAQRRIENSRAALRKTRS